MRLLHLGLHVEIVIAEILVWWSALTACTMYCHLIIALISVLLCACTAPIYSAITKRYVIVELKSSVQSE